MPKKSKPIFPKLLYVWHEVDKDEMFLMESDQIQNVKDGVVAVYEFKQVGVKTTTHHLNLGSDSK